MRTKQFAGLLFLVVFVLFSVSGLAMADDPKAVPAVEKINLNTAPAEVLAQLEGVGTAYAQRIIEYRQTNGLFSHIEELKNVKGIGDKIFEKNKHRITVDTTVKPQN